MSSGIYIEWYLYRVVFISSGLYIAWSLYRVVFISSGLYIEWSLYRVVYISSGLYRGALLYHKCTHTEKTAYNTDNTDHTSTVLKCMENNEI